MASAAARRLSWVLWALSTLLELRDPDSTLSKDYSPGAGPPEAQLFPPFPECYLRHASGARAPSFWPGFRRFTPTKSVNELWDPSRRPQAPWDVRERSRGVRGERCARPTRRRGGSDGFRPFVYTRVKSTVVGT